MNRREAKREACMRAHGVILTALAGADEEWLGRYGEEGAAKVAAALEEIAEELLRRAGR